MTVTELRARMDAQEFVGWQHIFLIEHEEAEGRRNRRRERRAIRRAKRKDQQRQGRSDSQEAPDGRE